MREVQSEIRINSLICRGISPSAPRHRRDQGGEEFEDSPRPARAFHLRFNISSAELRGSMASSLVLT